MEIKARKIVVTSGKGGVGKTAVAANLGIRLARASKRVCIMDADFGLNNLDVVTGVENLVIYDVADCVEGRCRAKQAIVECPSAKNVYILPSVHSLAKCSISEKGVNELIEGLSSLFDYIIIDCPAGITDGFSLAVKAAEEALVVTTPQLSSLRDADKVLSLLRGYGLKSVRLVVNRIRGDLVASGEMLSPEEIEKTLRCRLAGVIPEDDNVFLRNAGLIPSDSSSYKAFKILASNVATGKSKIYDYVSKYSGFWGAIRRGIKRNV